MAPEREAARIGRATSAADFEVAHGLIAMLAAWDVAQSEALGFHGPEVLDLYYRDTPDALAARFGSDATPLLVAWLGETPVGCGAVDDAAGGVGEIKTLFVRPEFRGRGVAPALIGALDAWARMAGYARLRLETAAFMTAAIRLYQANGFLRCEPFHRLSPEDVDLAVFMDRPL